MVFEYGRTRKDGHMKIQEVILIILSIIERVFMWIAAILTIREALKNKKK